MDTQTLSNNDAVSAGAIPDSGQQARAAEIQSDAALAGKDCNSAQLTQSKA